MRKYGLIFFLVLGTLISCNNNSNGVSGDVVHNPISASGEDGLEDVAAFEFRETLHDFGTVIEGETVSYSFKFKNTGKHDLIISNVSASCGCTATKYTKEPDPAGEEGVAANTQPNKSVLRIKAKVISPNDL